VITIDHLIDRANLYDMALFQQHGPIAHGFYQRVRMTSEHEDTGALNQRLHATLGPRREPRVACSYPLVEKENVRID
jgi:hypothetical protein